MWTTLIAVAGTLLGVLATGLVSGRADARSRAAAHREAQLDALTALVVALADHRTAMWLREEARLSGAPETAALRDASHTTRSAVTAPHVRLTVLLPGLAPAADAAVAATYALRGAPTAAELAGLRAAAAAAAEQLAVSARQHFGS